jgi:hypothetical protein
VVVLGEESEFYVGLKVMSTFTTQMSTVRKLKIQPTTHNIYASDKNVKDSDNGN